MNQNEISKVERFRQFKKEIRGSERYLVVGIDIAKHKHHAFLGTAIGKTVFRRLIVENSASGFEHLLTQVQFYMTRDGLDRVIFGLEPTGVYHKPLAEFLVEQGYLVVYVTNDAIKKNRALLDGRWDKNDTKDAANVADLVSRGKCHYYDLPHMGLRDIRSLLLLRKRLKKQEHGIKTRIRNNLVAQYFPELDSYWNRSEPESLSIVRWCLAPAKIDKLQFKDFFQMVTTCYRGHRQYQRLSKIWEIAPYSIGCKAGSALALEAKIMVEGLYAIRTQIADIDKHIKEMCQGFFEYDLLLSIPGFGPYVSAAVLAAIGNPDRFENPKQVLRLAGLDLNANRSGQKSASAVPIISRKGKVELRYALYQAALIASSVNTAFTAYFTKLLRGRERERGIRTKMRVKIAAKLLIIAWTLMKKGCVFCPDYLRID